MPISNDATQYAYEDLLNSSEKNHLVWQVSSVYKTWSMHNENLKDGPQKSGLNFDEFGPIMYTMSISTF